jgi:DUF2934 family protein
MGGTVGGEKTAMSTELEFDMPTQATTESLEIEVRIRSRAYELWEQRGRGHGRATEDWLGAEKEIADAISKAAGTPPGKTARGSTRRKVK